MPKSFYLTTAEVCAYLRLKERTVYDLVARRAIPCSRATGKLLFPRALIDRWVESHVEMAGPALAAPPPIVAGSSDPLLEWTLRECGCGLATLFEGSGAGLRRFAAAEAVVVGLHILAEDGSYNVGALRRLAGIPDLLLLQWAWRDQGLVVQRGNPLGIGGLADLVDKGPRIVRRQADSGAEILLEALMERAGLPIGSLNVADRVALTESESAAAVADGAADCGLAIAAVARRFGLDFVPLHRERFDLALRRRSYFEPSVQRLFAFARTEAFRKQADALGGYDVQAVGTVEFNA
jgi:putative molybdopterin biosynthesis protein